MALSAHLLSKLFSLFGKKCKNKNVLRSFQNVDIVDRLMFLFVKQPHVRIPVLILFKYKIKQHRGKFATREMKIELITATSMHTSIRISYIFLSFCLKSVFKKCYIWRHVNYAV